MNRSYLIVGKVIEWGVVELRMLAGLCFACVHHVMQVEKHGRMGSVRQNSLLGD